MYTLPCNYVRVGTLRSARFQLSCLNRAGMILFVSRMTPQIELHFYSILASFTRKTRRLGSIFKIIKPGTFSYRQAICQNETYICPKRVQTEVVSNRDVIGRQRVNCRYMIWQEASRLRCFGDTWKERHRRWRQLTEVVMWSQSARVLHKLRDVLSIVSYSDASWRLVSFTVCLKLYYNTAHKRA